MSTTTTLRMLGGSHRLRNNKEWLQSYNECFLLNLTQGTEIPAVTANNTIMMPKTF
jgi:hypothetical protein